MFQLPNMKDISQDDEDDLVVNMIKMPTYLSTVPGYCRSILEKAKRAGFTFSYDYKDSIAVVKYSNSKLKEDVSLFDDVLEKEGLYAVQMYCDYYELDILDDFSKEILDAQFMTDWILSLLIYNKDSMSEEVFKELTNFKGFRFEHNNVIINAYKLIGTIEQNFANLKDSNRKYVAKKMLGLLNEVVNDEMSNISNIYAVLQEKGITF